MLISKTEFDLMKSRTKTVPLSCNYCKRIFYKTKHSVQTSIKFHGGEPKYCSRKCKSNSSKTSIIVNCNTCNKEISKTPSNIGKNNFCNHSCSATFQNKNKSYGNRRSKLELHLEEEIKTNYPDLKVEYNSKQLIGSELDFYFPQLKLAVELNGIFHYEPIYGSKTFERIQNNDKQKQQVCNAKGIELAIIDSSSCSYLNAKAKDKYWSILNNLLGSVINRTEDLKLPDSDSNTGHSL